MKRSGRAALVALAASLVSATAVALPDVEDRLPDAYDHQLVLRVEPTLEGLLSNAYYETSNPVMRGTKDEDGLFEPGLRTAERFRALATRSAGVFVLRDALFSQPDHPYDQQPLAPMLPPSYVTVAIAECREGRTIVPVEAPEASADGAWARLGISSAFGSFPASERLLVEATRPLSGASRGDAERTRNARTTLGALASDTRALAEACSRGARAVAARGAERIADADRLYFGAEARRSRFVPISVANPNTHEVRDEGKGFVAFGRALAERDVRMARTSVLRRRLADGPIALERFDLSKPAERRLAIRWLEALVPRGSRGAAVWVWVNGGLDDRGIGGHDALPYIPTFREELARSRVAVQRIRLLSKPHVELPRAGARSVLDAAVARHRELGLPVSLNLTGRVLFRRLGR